MSLIVSNAGTISLKSAVVWMGWAVAFLAFMINTGLPGLAHIWGWSLPLAQMQDTWNTFCVPLLSGFGIHAARLWNQDLPSGGTP